MITRPATPSMLQPQESLPITGWSIAARWLMVLLIALSVLAQSEFSWNVGSEPLLWVLIVYVVFASLTSIAFVMSMLRSFLVFAAAGDIVLLALATFFSHGYAHVFAPLFLIPVMSLAARRPPLVGLGIGLVSALLFAIPATFAAWLGGIDMYLLGIGIGASIIGVLPFLINNQIEQWQRSIEHHMHQTVQHAQAQVAEAQQQATEALEQTQFLYDMATAFATSNDATPDQKTILSALLNKTNQLIPFSHAVVLLRTDDDERNDVRVEVGVALHPVDPGKIYSLTHEGTLDTLLTPGHEPRLFTNLHEEPELTAIATLRTCKAVWAVPLHYGVPVYGLLLIGTENATHFYPDQQELLVIVARFAGVALRNGQLLAELRPYQERRIASERKAREELTRYVHDGLAQTSARIATRLDIVRRILQEDPAAAAQEMQELCQQFRQFHQFEVRELLTALSPLPIEQGLYDVLNHFVEQKRALYPQTKIVLQAEPIKGILLHHETASMLYNIAQESINNALKYAEASQLLVRCTVNNNLITLTVQDNGKGFDVEKSREAARKRGSFGMANIGERARLVGGQARILSKIGKGSFVQVVVPIQHHDHAPSS